ncbi:MAG: isoprenylcysteine carboxylmethyltransferase family protein [Thermodesulfobacteriota bacterium]|nr:isoprenylcysteine carboxylmethyltransferase family protein [Thermodesulfobacteriota bacterium]
MLYIIKEYQIPFSRMFAAAIIAILLFSHPSHAIGPLTEIFFDTAGFLLVIACTFGRIWSLSYINGHKTRDLMVSDPYSIVRNPLYLFSLAGAIGIGIASMNSLALCLIVLMFGVYYPFVIRSEEQRLLMVHKDAFETYRKRTPSFIPRFSLYSTPETYPVDARLFARSFMGAVWFPVGFGLIEIIKTCHETGILPVLFYVP